jgi:hypothetical protein
MDSKSWLNRMKSRNDMSSRLIHLTRGKNDDEAFENLWKILIDKKIKGSGSGGYVIGATKAVCLQELPLTAIVENLLYEDSLNDKIRYSPFGIRLSKPFVYKKGGRPVIYENSTLMKNYLPESEYWRIVNLNLTDKESCMDWTHEREWRVPDKLRFSYGCIEVIVKNGKYYRKLVERCISEDRMDILTEIRGIVTLNSIRA